MNGKSGNGRVDGLSPVARQSNICPAQNQEEIVVACVGLAGRGKETPYALGFRHDTNCADRRQPGRDARNWRRRRSAARGFIDSWEDSRENCSLKAGDIKQVVLEQLASIVEFRVNLQWQDAMRPARQLYQPILQHSR
jgi:hypothetical protein